VVRRRWLFDGRSPRRSLDVFHAQAMAP